MLDAEFAEIAANFRVVKPALPVIAQLQAAGKLQAAVEEVAIPGRNLYFDRYDILVRFRPPARGSAPSTGATIADQSTPSGRVLVGELGPDEFLIAGFDAALDFKPPWARSIPVPNSFSLKKALMKKASGKPPARATAT